MYDSPTPFPVNKNVQSSVIPLCDTWFCDTQSFENTIGKKHALKKYDQFALNTSCFFGELPDKILP